MSEQRFVDAMPRRRKATAVDGVRDALMRAARDAKAPVDRSRLPRNRAEARDYMRGNGPWMRFRYEVGDDGVRRAVRVRL